MLLRGGYKLMLEAKRAQAIRQPVERRKKKKLSSGLRVEGTVGWVLGKTPGLKV